MPKPTPTRTLQVVVPPDPPPLTPGAAQVLLGIIQRATRLKLSEATDAHFAGELDHVPS